MRQLIQSFWAALDRRLNVDDPRPVALALSGGGDSVALLRLAAPWARARGRRLLALTVDHGLHPDSAAWTDFAGRAAAQADVTWRALRWTGDKPATGLPAAARAARHRLLAEAAREAGARVVLMGHTADDVAEAEWMRAHGASTGAPRAWAPSPVWPEGRGLMLARPLLDVRRAALRAFLTSEGASWLEDPANVDPRFLRSHARAALAGAEASASATADATADATASPLDPGAYAWAGAIMLDPSSSPWRLGAALLSASGGATPPRAVRISGLAARIAGGGPLAATLAGARAETREDRLLITREPGRKGVAETALPAGRPVIWDGRFRIVAPEAGWRVGALKGRMAALAPADAAIVRRAPAPSRAAMPVLIRDGAARPVLAWRAAETRCLVAGRLIAATGGIGHEGDLDRAIGETPPADLFLNQSDGPAPSAWTRGPE